MRASGLIMTCISLSNNLGGKYVCVYGNVVLGSINYKLWSVGID